MSIGGIFQALTDDRPQLGSTAIARGRLVKQPGGQVVATPVGVFTLRRGATVVLSAVSMIAAPVEDYGPDVLIYPIADTAMTRGQYTWDMLLTDPVTGYKSLKSGRFTLG